MNNIRIFYLKNCHFLVVKFSVYLDRRVFVMRSDQCLAIKRYPKLSTKTQRKKRALMHFADDTGPDQPAHERRLIRNFVARLQNRWILKFMSTSRKYLDQSAWMRTLI